MPTSPLLYVGKPANPPFTLNIVKGDTVAYAFTFTDGTGAPLDLSTATSASYIIHPTTSSTPTLSGSATISGSTITVTLTGSDTGSLSPVVSPIKPVTTYGDMHIRVSFSGAQKTLVIVGMTLTV